uniref:YggT family protein n=1 Tax=Ningiella ruwaisensis TaxID=2364274 RepID=UPI00109FB060|nr:YggT family protein [Ningiella ruwaisensis]
MNAIEFLVRFAFGAYISIILVRMWLQLARADFYNPASQFVVKATQPVVGPLRRFIPALGQLDTATLLFAYVMAVLKIITLSFMITGGIPGFLSLLVPGVIVLIGHIFDVVFYILIIRAILSWVSQGGNPIEMVMYQLTEPLLAPIRRIIPPMGGLDLSILIAILAIQFIRILIGDLTGIRI